MTRYMYLNQFYYSVFDISLLDLKIFFNYFIHLINYFLDFFYLLQILFFIYLFSKFIFKSFTSYLINFLFKIHCSVYLLYLYCQQYFFQ